MILLPEHLSIINAIVHGGTISPNNPALNTLAQANPPLIHPTGGGWVLTHAGRAAYKLPYPPRPGETLLSTVPSAVWDVTAAWHLVRADRPRFAISVEQVYTETFVQDTRQIYDERLCEANPDIPLLLLNVRYQDYGLPIPIDTIILLDGAHRTLRAYQEGRQEMHAYLISADEGCKLDLSPSFLHSD